MHIATLDIAVFPLRRGAVLVGPRAGFGLRRREDLLRSPPEIRRLFDRLILLEGGPLLRGHFVRWGVEPEVRLGRDHAAMSRWLTDQVVRGRIGALPVPDPLLAFAGRSQAQRDSVLRAAQNADYKPEEGKPLPHDLETRFVGVMSFVPPLIDGEAKIGFADLVRTVSLPAIAGRLVAWIGPSFGRGADLTLLAAECRTLSADIIEAMDDLVDAVGATNRALNMFDLQRVANTVATSVSTLIMHGVMERLVRQREILGSQGGGAAQIGYKPDLPKNVPRQVKVRPPTPPAPAAKPPGKAKAGAPATDSGSGDETPPPPSEKTSPVPPAKTGGPLPKKVGQREPGAVDMTPEILEEIEAADQVRLGPPLQKDGWPDLRAKELATFSAIPKAVDLAPGTKIYRVIDADSNPNGGFWSLEPPPVDEGDWRSGAAVLNDWNGDGQYVEHVVGPEGLKGWLGPARAQLSSDGKSALKGGADQFVIPPNSLSGLSQPKPTPWNSPDG